MINDVYQLYILCSSSTKLAVLGHIPLICLKLCFRCWITASFDVFYYFSMLLRFLRYSRSVSLSASFCTWVFYCLRRSRCRTTCLTRSNSLSSSISNMSSCLSFYIVSSIFIVRRPDKCGLRLATPSPVIPLPLRTCSFALRCVDVPPPFVFEFYLATSPVFRVTFSLSYLKLMLGCYFLYKPTGMVILYLNWEC